MVLGLCSTARLPLPTDDHVYPLECYCTLQYRFSSAPMPDNVLQSPQKTQHKTTPTACVAEVTSQDAPGVTFMLAIQQSGVVPHPERSEERVMRVRL